MRKRSERLVSRVIVAGTQEYTYDPIVERTIASEYVDREKIIDAFEQFSASRAIALTMLTTLENAGFMVIPRNESKR